ncbi:unnamed protein product [Orchesella dallaii]|uniref:C2H2-type domain-containing protein n=1 Tax=Orchesella dallaii TaxID=48710 RepID=A0ABP1S1Q8_9HEXA
MSYTQEKHEGTLATAEKGKKVRNRAFQFYHFSVNEPTLACPQCDEVFKVKDDLRRHHKRRHYEGDRQHVCQHCGVSIVKKSQFERHLRIHEREDKTSESFRNDFDPISQHQHNNLRNNTQETEVNVNTQGTSQTLEIQGTLEASLSPAADIKDPVPDFG